MMKQLALIATMKAGVSYVDYHIQFHQRIAKLLRKHQIITDMSEEAMVENDLTGPFMRTVSAIRWACRCNDVAGFMQDDSGTHLAAPAKYPYLRCTRILQPGMVLNPSNRVSTSSNRFWHRGVKGSSANTSTGRKLKH